MDFDPGGLTHRVAIERPVRTEDGAGGASIAFEPFATVWAAIEPLSANEDGASGRLATRVTHRVTIRWRADLTGAMRLRHRGRILRIASLRDADESRRFLVIEAEEERI
ncbi:head-tail adaptor protein [Kaistia algarum]|uniref:phage head closure protein n=1 Tax=Kaistia algarum TaxID=2083279 RepID=UPI000CE90184|nr:phage head closure protein [Kaistia algarum]MCX5512126.1 phage head closure protein [Kaistia algarum]PPE80236.1 head-tail adaptor protein [Kaistia algarum]